MKTSIFISFFILACAYADICNPHATLLETDSFYLTQPIVKNVTIDLSNYIDTFKTVENNLANFQSLLSIYSTNEFIENTEPIALTPYDDDFNFYPIARQTRGKDSFNACSTNNGRLINLTPQNRKQIVAALKTLNLETTPVATLPSFSMLSFPDFEILVNQGHAEGSTRPGDKK